MVEVNNKAIPSTPKAGTAKKIMVSCATPSSPATGNGQKVYFVTLMHPMSLKVKLIL